MGMTEGNKQGLQKRWGGSARYTNRLLAQQGTGQQWLPDNNNKWGIWRQPKRIGQWWQPNGKNELGLGHSEAAWGNRATMTAQDNNERGVWSQPKEKGQWWQPKDVDNDCSCHQWSIHLPMIVQALPKRCRKSTRQCTIVRRAREDACIAGGTPQEHEGICNCKVSPW